MIYNLLKDIRQQLVAKEYRTPEEQGALDRINRALPAMLNGRDTETLARDEILVRICPDAKRPVLACHNGNGQCLCLHNESEQEDAIDVELWLRSGGKECDGSRKLLEAVADLAYNAGADKLCQDRDSRETLSTVIAWAVEFERSHAATDWDTEDYLSAIDEYYRKKANPQGSGRNAGLKPIHTMDKETAEDIIRENRRTDGYEVRDYLEGNEETVREITDGEELLEDFDLWRERSDLETGKILDRNYWGSIGGF